MDHIIAAIRPKTGLDHVKALISRIPPEGVAVYSTVKSEADEILHNGFRKLGNGRAILFHVIPGSLDRGNSKKESPEEIARKINGSLLVAAIHAMKETEKAESSNGKKVDWKKINPNNFPALVFVRGNPGGSPLTFFSAPEFPVLEGVPTYGFNWKSKLPEDALVTIAYFKQGQHNTAITNARDDTHLTVLIGRKLHGEARRAFYSILRR